MSGRHQNTTWRGVDGALLEAFEAARGDRQALAGVLVGLPPSADHDPAHADDVWQRAPEILRPYLLRRFVQGDPARWGPPLAEALMSFDDEFVRGTFEELAVAFDLWSVPDTYGVLIHTDARYASRFGVYPEPVANGAAWCRAFGGPTDPEPPDLRESLLDAHLDVATVLELAPLLVVPTSLPALAPVLPHGVEHFEVDPTHLVAVMGEVRDLFARAATEHRAVSVHWHANP